MTLAVDVSFSEGSDANFETHNIKACAYNDCLRGCTPETQSVSSPASSVIFSDAGSYYACVQSLDKAGNNPLSWPQHLLSSWMLAQAGNTARIDVDNVSYYSVDLSWQAAVDNVSLSSNLSYSVYYSENPAFDSVAEVKLMEHFLLGLQMLLQSYN